MFTAADLRTSVWSAMAYANLMPWDAATRCRMPGPSVTEAAETAGHC